MRNCYILLFACATVRAVRLEITRDFSSKSLVLAIRHFIARRSKPALFVSDKFKPFKCANVKEFILKHWIKWEFILERSPLVGGFYQRLIGIIKSSLQKTLGKAKTSYVEMCTIISEVKGDINNRSLTHLNDERVNELLRPNRLI